MESIIFFEWDVVNIVFMSASVISTSFILLISLTSKLYRNALGNMVFWNLFADLVYSLSRLIVSFPFEKTQSLCNAMLGMTAYGRSSSIIWSTLFGHGLLKVCQNQNLDAINKNKRIYFFIGVCPAVICACMQVIMSFFEVSTNPVFCNIRLDSDLVLPRMFAVIAPSIIACVLSIFFYLRAGIHLRQFLSERSSKEILTFLLYPLIMVFFWMPSLVTNFISTLNVNVNATVQDASLKLAMLVGVCHAIIYGFSRGFLREFVKIKARCFKRRESIERRNTDELLLEDQEALTESLRKRKSVQVSKTPTSSQSGAGLNSYPRVISQSSDLVH